MHTDGCTTDQVLTDTTRRRAQAVTLLETLEAARSASEAHLSEMGSKDLIKQVTGKSSMDNAIASTKKLIESFDRVLDGLRNADAAEDLEMLARLDRQALVAG